MLSNPFNQLPQPFWQKAEPIAFIQKQILEFLDVFEGKTQKHLEESWEYKKGLGGGLTCIYENQTLLEKGAVNFSAVQGSSFPASGLPGAKALEGQPYCATGLSLVLHPHHPCVPTIHMNIRFFETQEQEWLGGGIDLTPYYPELLQVKEFHKNLFDLCHKHQQPYNLYKEQCDRYFYIPHRQEARGVGGLFFDRLDNTEANMNFVLDLGKSFCDLYQPFFKNSSQPCTPEMKSFQLHRRGRYAEFNLLYDRGTHFGLQSGGRTESILASLPPQVNWHYTYPLQPNSPESYLSDFYLQAQDWLQP